MDSQVFETYLPVYDTIPQPWEEARQFFIENLKKISIAVNIREIGWFLDDERLTGQQFIPPAIVSGDSQQYRSILRKVIDFSPLAAGVNTRAHGIVFDANFTLMHLYAAATDAVALTAIPIPNGANTISMNAVNVIITSTAAFTRAFAVVEYIQEL